MKQSFYPNNLTTNTRIISSYLPAGQMFSAKDINDSNFNKLMRSLAVEFGRTQYKLYELVQEYDVSTTTNLIDEWEKALGIPCACFSNDVPIAQRRLQCIAKLAKMNIATVEDWIALAKFFGYNISIEYMRKYMVLPMVLPFILGSLKAAKFTIIVNFLDLKRPSNVLTLTLPFTLGGSPNLIQCLFNVLKPANVNVIYKFLG